MKSELFVGVQQEKRIISVSPKDTEFPICGLHIADTYQSDSLRKGNLFTGEKTLIVESTDCSPSVNSCHTAPVDGCTSAGAGRYHTSPLAPQHCCASHHHHHFCFLLLLTSLFPSGVLSKPATKAVIGSHVLLFMLSPSNLRRAVELSAGN